MGYSFEFTALRFLFSDFMIRRWAYRVSIRVRETNTAGEIINGVLKFSNIKGFVRTTFDEKILNNILFILKRKTQKNFIKIHDIFSVDMSDFNN